MGYIDLHVHSSASDGTLSPTEVVSCALAKQLSAIALTDHDTVSGIQEALDAAAGTDLEVIPGIELSCVYHIPGSSSKEGREIHILGLFIDHKKEELNRRLDHLLQIRNDRNQEILRRMQAAGIHITWEDLTFGKESSSITRAQFAKVLLEKGYVTSYSQAFKNYLSYDGPYCIRKTAVTPEYAMETLLTGGAAPFLAHPMQYKMGYEEIRELLVCLKGMGLAGVEAYHSSHNQHQSGRLKTMAKELDLLVSGGSDFHGSIKPDIDLGCGRGKLRLSDLFLKDIKTCLFSPNHL